MKLRITGRNRTYLILALTLVLPAAALVHSGWDLRWIGAYLIVINALTYLTYRRDKIRAGNGEWRTPEDVLRAIVAETPVATEENFRP